jgi:hypothetical protein
VSCSYLPNPYRIPANDRRRRRRWNRDRSSARSKWRCSAATAGWQTIAGLDFFNKQIVPALTDEDRTRMEFHVIGGDDPPRSILKRLKQESAVIIRGHVEDIGAEYVSADVVLVPRRLTLGFRTADCRGDGLRRCGRGAPGQRGGHAGIGRWQELRLAGRGTGSPGSESVPWARIPAGRPRIRSSARDTFEKHYASTVVAGQMIAVMQGCFDERRSRLAERVDA